ncbi:hypothetical protein E2I00_018031 [Balaenoptera physalus]|uniref:Uncharacterized protein n=1 Tax=Balaenoptera physalus TaxID=9770 RepID=A0A6A1QDJ1_BALPH|nr:hypothetical protein E2I00_018031 [Balaenoptera physalus]
MTGSRICCNFLNMWKKSKISTMYYLNQDAKLSNLFLQASSPTTGTAPRSQSRLSVCPSTQDICRSAILHDMSEASLEQSTPVVVLSPARKESGKKSVKQRPRRRRRAALRYKHTEEQVKGRRGDFHLQIPSHRWSETDTDSSDSSSADESHWIQAKRRAQVKFRLSRRRRNKKPSGNLDESSAPNEIHPVHLGSEGKKRPELTECESYSLNLHRGKGATYQGCSGSLPRRSSDIKRPSRKHEGSRGRYHRRGFLQEPPATYHEGSDHLKACRSVTPEKDLITAKYISSCCELRAICGAGDVPGSAVEQIIPTGTRYPLLTLIKASRRESFPITFL